MRKELLRVIEKYINGDIDNEQAIVQSKEYIENGKDFIDTKNGDDILDVFSNILFLLMSSADIDQIINLKEELELLLEDRDEEYQMYS
ncbi:MAG: hypothetical protein ACK5LC_03715 [Coprobacillaceae bacterium]